MKKPIKKSKIKVIKDKEIKNRIADALDILLIEHFFKYGKTDSNKKEKVKP